jgi:hypothetical protein
VDDGPDEEPQAVSDSATSPTTAVVQPRDAGDDVIMSSTSASGLSGCFGVGVSSLPTTLTRVGAVDDAAYVTTRRQLRGIAESFVAGPQYRAAGTIRLAVRPDGFTGVSIPVAVHGNELVFGGDAAPLTGRVGTLAAATGLDVGPPEGVYEIVDPLDVETVLDIDEDSAAFIYRSLYAGGFALKSTLQDQHPVLWPEHFDVGVTDDEVNYGVSPGDDFHPLPYAYVGPWTSRIGPFWNAPFGAFMALESSLDVDGLAGVIGEFFERGREEL